MAMKCAELNAQGYSSVISWMNSMGSSPEDMNMIPEDVRRNAVRCFTKYEVAILVSDMSGFTKLTRKYGAIHFASIIARNRQICHPILRRNGACFIATEGDNFIVIFPTATGALIAAHEMQRSVAEWNKEYPPDRQHFALTLNGVGVHYGKGPVVDVTGKMHGVTFDDAYMIGEEMCTKGCVALSQRVMDEIAGSPEFAKANFRPHQLEEDADPSLSEVVNRVGAVYELDMEGKAELEVPDVDAEDEFLQSPLRPFARRHSRRQSDLDLQKVDEHLKRTYSCKRSVLMFDFEYENADDANARLALKFEALAKLDRVLTNCNAVGLEDVLYTFTDPCDAVYAAVACRRCMELVNSNTSSDTPSITIKGYGVHAGDLLYVPGTDVHWGDPVNTASKLGQDTAKDGEIIISDTVHQACCSDTRLKDLRYEQIEILRSGVAFICFKVFDTVGFKQRVLAQWQHYAGENNKEVDRKVLHTLFKQIRPDLSNTVIDSLLDAASVPATGAINIEDFLDWASGR